MKKEESHYFSEFPDAKFKLHTIPVSLRKHLYIFRATPGVFSFKKLDLGTKILIENMVFPKNRENFLDLGCGYGPIGIVIAYELSQANVYFIDINKRAVWCTRENIKSNLSDELKRVRVLQGNYFDPLKGKKIRFDGIYMNPPMRAGRVEFLKIFDDISYFLNSKGFFQFVIKRKMGAEFILQSLRRRNSEDIIDIICKRSGYWVFNYVRTN
ncbi:MAG: class I SAM-dependent methyltransferase [Candidatus Lokiarchaeota archaeon]|nr:class I SAM-dependent methyltransferase [Candidatus Lokiarchaeota archaeon]